MNKEVSPTSRPGFLGYYIYRCIWLLTNLVFRTIYRLKVRTEGRFPRQGGVLIVSNHVTHFDPPLIDSAFFRKVHFMARSTLMEKSDFMKMLFKVASVVPVDRDGSGREAFNTAVELLKSGKVVCIFPEGTRSPDGEVKAFQRGAVLLAKRARVPVVAAGIAGAYECWPKGSTWPGTGKIRIRFSKPIPPEKQGRGGVDLREEVIRLKQEA